MLGDSLSAGYGIAQGQEWVTLLSQRFAREAQPVKVVNASISGETTSGGVARIKPLLERETPAWVLIELGGNDGLRGMSLVAMEANLQAMVDAVEESGAQPVLLGIKIPPNYGNKYRSRFEQVFVDVAERNDVALLPFLLDGVGGIDNLMQADRIHPNQQAQPLIADNVWEFLKPVMVKRDN
ncbi:arylesterase [Ketobacter alkanivorans]|uniref:arylesterase n=1 Tax=Ketobacter alkanivorans TaxID=1917421 RepID=UPI001F1EFBDA|nr:arylesterase [Ketobacter alkanivorans]